jgi:amino acid permease
MTGPYHYEDGVRLDDLNKDEISFTDLKEDFYWAPVPKERTILTRIGHSFKRADARAAPGQAETDFGFPQAGDTSQLHRKLKSRHIQMIAIGGTIGAGLFIGSGKALATGGPGAVILDFSLVAFMVFCTINALGELATMYPVQGRIPLKYKINE